MTDWLLTRAAVAAGTLASLASGEGFEEGIFMPHGHCYLWRPGLLWTHVATDTAIGMAYLGISVVLYQLVRKVRLPFSPMFLAFGLFIAACGMTHFMEVWNVWEAHYWLAAWVKVATALASVVTFLLLIPLGPKVVAFAKGAALSEERRVQLEHANAELEALRDTMKRELELQARDLTELAGRTKD